MLVILTSLGTAAALRAHNNAFTRQFHQRRWSSSNSHEVPGTRSKPVGNMDKQAKRASTSLLILAVLFSALEAPSFIAEIFIPASNQDWTFVLNCLKILDSCCNFVIFVLANSTFRRTLRLLLRCQLHGTSAPLAATTLLSGRSCNSVAYHRGRAMSAQQDSTAASFNIMLVTSKCTDGQRNAAAIM